MKQKHVENRIKQVKLLSELSPCCRNKFGCLIINPDTKSVVSEGYNGLPKGCESKLCGGDTCLRDTQNVISGDQFHIGCHHAEANAITHASRLGVSTKDCWLFVNGEPCLACAKLIHHAGISKVFYVKGGYSRREGVDYLDKYKVSLVEII